jgi:F-type H+-transporting ATPase subunit epsilon
VAVAAQTDETLTLSIITPERNVFSGEIISAVVSTAAGMIEILPGHEALLAILAPGPLSLRMPSAVESQTFLLEGGFILVQEEETLVLADGVAEPEA